MLHVTRRLKRISCEVFDQQRDSLLKYAQNLPDALDNIISKQDPTSGQEKSLLDEPYLLLPEVTAPSGNLGERPTASLIEVETASQIEDRGTDGCGNNLGTNFNSSNMHAYRRELVAEVIIRYQTYPIL